MWQRGVAYVAALIQILRIVLKEDIPLVHLQLFHILPVADLFFMLALRMLNVRVVATIHDLIPLAGNMGPTTLFRWLYQVPDGLIVHASMMVTTLHQDFAIPPEKIVMVPLGIGPLPRLDAERRTEARAQLGLPPTTPTILFFGQIKRVKGLDLLCDAFATVVARFPNARLLVVGPTWKESLTAYQNQVAALGLTDQVDFRIGFIPDDQISTYFAAADVVALPYHHVYQSSVVLRAMAYGCPVVATAVGGLPETLDQGRAGLLVPPNDPLAFGAALNSLLCDAETAAKLGHAGQQHVRAANGWSVVAAQTGAVYRTALKSHKTPEAQ